MLTLKVKPASFPGGVSKPILGSWRYVTPASEPASLHIRENLGLLPKEAIHVKTTSPPGQVTSRSSSSVTGRHFSESAAVAKGPVGGVILKSRHRVSVLSNSASLIVYLSKSVRLQLPLQAGEPLW